MTRLYPDVLLLKRGYRADSIQRELVMSTSRATSSNTMIQRLANDPMLVLDRMAFQNGAVNLGLGFPDFPPPDTIIQALSEAATGDNHMLHHYTRPYGHPRLVKVLSEMYSKLNSVEMDPTDNILITIGAFQGLSSICQSLIDPGDEVILLEPFYTPYEDLLEIRGAVPVFVPLHPHDKGEKQLSSSSWKFHKSELENAVTSKTKAIFLNNPMNPLGKVFDKEELLEISDLCLKHNLLCVADEVYEWLTYGEKQHTRIASFPNMWERTITLGSAGKSFNVTGWKIGWCLGPKHLIQVLQNYHFATIRTSSSILQEAIAVAFETEMLVLGKPESYFKTFCKEAEQKRNKLCKYLISTGFNAIVPDGCFYIIADISNVQGNDQLPGGREVGLAARVVTDLTRDSTGSYRHLYVDNFFSGPQLFQYLLDDGIHECGTCRINRKGFPSAINKDSVKQKGDFLMLQSDSLVNAEISDEALDYRFAKMAVTEKKLCVMPFSIFYSKQHRHLCEKYVRLCFVKTDETLTKAKAILDEWNNI